MNRLRPVALLVGACLHLVALEGLWHGRGTSWVLLAHVAGAAAWGFGASSWLPGNRPASILLPAGCALVFPLLGPLASLVLFQGLRARGADENDRRYLIWNQQPQEDQTALPAGASVQSIAEILQSPRTQLRRNAILALRELEAPLAIPLLRKGLQDSDEQVRIYAQNILSAMLEGFEERIKDLEGKLRADPGAVATAHRLAEQFFELVYLDVAGDDETAAHYLAKAIALLETAITIAPASPELSFLGLKYALRARDPAGARRWCARLPAASLHAQHVLPWRMELAFLEGDWAELRRLLTAFARAGFINPRLEEIVDFWLGPRAVSA